MFQSAWSGAGGGQTDVSWLAPCALPLMGDCRPRTEWRLGGCGDSLWTGEQEEKSFLVTYFPKLPLAPVSFAWTVPSRPLSTQARSSSLA